MHHLDIPSSLAGLRRRIRERIRGRDESARPARETLRPEFLAGLKRLDLRAKVLLSGFLQGIHRTPRRGFSAEFSEYRTYVPGDDPRWMDWRLYARTDRLYIKRFQDESSARALLVVDASASMGYRSAGAAGQAGAAPVFSKLDYAITLAAAFTCLLQGQRDRVGLYSVGGAERTGVFLPPRSSRQHARRVLQELSALRAGGDAPLDAALARVAAEERRRGLVVVCSDGLCGRERLLDSVRRLRHRGQDVLFFQVWDPAELDPPLEPGVSFRDPETLARFEPLAPEEYRRRAREHLAELRRGLLAAGADHLFLLTTTPFDRALLRFLKLRKRKH